MPFPNQLLFINTILLGGSSEEKIAAAAAAGFDQVELWRQDADAHPPGVADLARTLRGAAIGLTDFQVLLDFDGAPGDRRVAKRREALDMLDMAVQLGAGTLLAPASTDPRCERETIAEDLAWLAQQAAARGLRVAYEAMAWSAVNDTTPAAWRSVLQADQPNLGMVIDAFHIFARGRDVDDLDGIPAQRIFLVQLSDLASPIAPGQLIDTARHRRLLPGQGHFPIQRLLAKLETLDYAGPIGLEVFNDAMKARDPRAVAAEAMAALRTCLAPHGRGGK